ncbi:MAG: hypothetical protein JO297_10955 [Nitrososphaeraceae archaeon]|nr:hypothetical protein [Nitrososphaeraceae archaeon]
MPFTSRKMNGIILICAMVAVIIATATNHVNISLADLNSNSTLKTTKMPSSNNTHAATTASPSLPTPRTITGSEITSSSSTTDYITSRSQPPSSTTAAGTVSNNTQQANVNPAPARNITLVGPSNIIALPITSEPEGNSSNSTFSQGGNGNSALIQLGKVLTR